jgi:hypothetical protein
MKIILANLYLGFLLFNSITSIAQVSPIAGGGSSKGNKGSISYSIGVVNFVQTSNRDINLSQGLQNPFELFLVTKDDTRGNFLVYPNPTNDVSFIVEKKYSGENLKYTIVDINGKVLERNSSISNKTKISLQQYNSGIYYLQIIKKNKNVGVFKILKY